jgi:hypothetical protein
MNVHGARGPFLACARAAQFAAEPAAERGARVAPLPRSEPPMSESAFPPCDLPGFLQLCAGEWLALRSSLALAEGGAEESWHRSERGELRFAYLAPEGPGDPGGLAISPPQGPTRRLRFTEDGRFHDEDATGGEGTRGDWRLWPDGSLELGLRLGELEVRERIWFTQPNLRLRSSVERRADGSPDRASFSSEIRRVSRPPAP